jgi:hypothetical protein
VSAKDLREVEGVIKILKIEKINTKILNSQAMIEIMREETIVTGEITISCQHSNRTRIKHISEQKCVLFSIK